METLCKASCRSAADQNCATKLVFELNEMIHWAIPNEVLENYIPSIRCGGWPLKWITRLLTTFLNHRHVNYFLHVSCNQNIRYYTFGRFKLVWRVDCIAKSIEIWSAVLYGQWIILKMYISRDEKPQVCILCVFIHSCIPKPCTNLRRILLITSATRSAGMKVDVTGFRYVLGANRWMLLHSLTCV